MAEHPVADRVAADAIALFRKLRDEAAEANKAYIASCKQALADGAETLPNFRFDQNRYFSDDEREKAIRLLSL